MSSLLEQAIIDAKALKEAALKNAEAAVIEKYAPEIKEAVESILEQGEEEEEEEETGEMFLGGEEEEGLEDITSAAESGEELCPCPPEGEQQTYEISASELLKAIKSDLEGEEMGLEEVMEMSDELANQILKSASEEQPLEEEEELEEGGLANRRGDPRQRRPEASPIREEEDEVDEELNLTDDNLEEIVKEMMKVDLSPVDSGWAGTPEKVSEHNDELMVAKAQDTEFKENYEALKSAYDKLQEQNKKFKDLILVAKEKLVEVNLSNAKLLYTNNVLSSASLNERQKNKIVEAISKTETVEEAKVIHETLQSAVGSVKRSRPQSLSEAVSRPTTTLPRRRQENFESPALDRMKVLAGINKR